MKLEKYFLLLALGVFAFALQSCDDDDNDGISVPAELSNALAKEHPNAQRIEWETKGTFILLFIAIQYFIRRQYHIHKPRSMSTQAILTFLPQERKMKQFR